MPDRVLDAALADLPSTPQRRSRWSSWRFLQMKVLVPIGAAAAVVLVSVMLLNGLVPRGPNVGGQAATPQPIRAQITYILGGDPVTLDIDASATESSLSGTAVISDNANDFAVGLECARKFDATTWMLGGEVTESRREDVAAGTRMAITVRGGPPQQISLWFEDPPPAADCPAFLDAVPADAVQNEEYFGPVIAGQIPIPG
jgi:hypothetical protein